MTKTSSSIGKHAGLPMALKYFLSVTHLTAPCTRFSTVVKRPGRNDKMAMIYFRMMKELLLYVQYRSNVNIHCIALYHLHCVYLSLPCASNVLVTSLRELPPHLTWYPTTRTHHLSFPPISYLTHLCPAPHPPPTRKCHSSLQGSPAPLHPWSYPSTRW